MSGTPNDQGRSTGPGLRVAALMDTRIVSGPGRQLAAIVPPLRELGIDVHPILFQRATGEATEYATFLREREIPFTLLTDTRRFDSRPLADLARFVGTWKPDIIQTHSYRPTALAWWLGRRGRTWKWAGFFHGLTTENMTVRLYHAIDRVLLRQADGVVVMAQSQLRHFQSMGPRVRVMNNAMLEPSPSAPDEELARALVSVPAPRLAVVGRLSSEKGVDVFLQALGLLHRGGLRAGALIAGDGPDRTALESLAAELGLSAHVRFLGRVEDTPAIYAACDAVVLPSRSEGLPNVLLEAIRAGRPVAVTRVGAVPDVLMGSAAGMLAPPGDAAALAEAIQRALREGNSDAARAARLSVVNRYSLRRRVEAHAQLYTELTTRER